MSKPLDNQQYVGINQNQQTQPTQVPLMSNYGQSFISTIDQASMAGQQQLLQMVWLIQIIWKYFITIFMLYERCSSFKLKKCNLIHCI